MQSFTGGGKKKEGEENLFQSLFLIGFAVSFYLPPSALIGKYDLGTGQENRSEKL